MDGINEFALTFLLNAAWQFTIVALVAAACARLLRQAPARYRHALWVAALVLGIALPLWSQYNLSVASPEARSSSPAATKATPTVLESDATANAIPAQPVQRDNANASNARSESVFQLETLLHRRRQMLPGLPPLMFGIVLAYALFLLYRLNALRRAWRETQKIRRSTYARTSPNDLRDVSTRCSALFKLRDVPIRYSSRVAAPVTIGWRKPLIILPESFLDADLPAETLLSVLGHEMAHIARRDFVLNIFYEFLRLPLSFHPLASLVTRQINRTRELACDELVAGRVLAADAYARSLVRVASALTTPAGHAAYSLGSLGVFDADILEERVMRLIEKRGRMSVRAGRLLMAASFSLLLTVALATSAFSFDFHSAKNENGLTQAQPAQTGAQEQADAQEQIDAPAQADGQAQTDAQPQADAAEKIRALSSADASERAAAACALGRRRAVQAIPALIQMLGDDAAIEPVKCWEGNNSWTPALATFKQASPGEEAAIALAAMGQPAVEPLVAALGQANASVRRNAAWAIGEVTGGMTIKRESAVQPLRSALQDGDEWVRIAAARALGEIRDERAVESLLATLSDNSGQVRQLAAWALGEMKERRAVESLGMMLLKDEGAGAREMAAWALGEIQDPKAVEPLNAALNDPEPRVRLKAKWALSEIQE
jgi:HEAT repeat protein/beta-lactamase regulating signal transducer with metallopeptidase domain